MNYFEYLVRSRFKSVRAFCYESGLHHSTVYAYMAGTRVPSLPIFMDFVEIFGVTAEDLWKNWYKEYSLNGKK